MVEYHKIAQAGCRQPGGPMLDTDAQTTLNSLRWHWEKAYAVNCDGESWTAIPAMAPDVVLTASSAMELRTGYAERLRRPRYEIERHRCPVGWLRQPV